jgi:hypothetical protein
MIAVTIVSMIIVPGKIAEWQAISPKQPTSAMQFLIDANDVGRHRWFIVFPGLVYFIAVSHRVGRRFRSL